MGADLSQLSMLELFRMEAGNLCGGMSNALIDLESQVDASAQLADLMRAAHSLKGAARIVGLDALVGLGHAMEDRLSAAQRQDFPLARLHIDTLLQATDIFARVVDIGDAQLPAWLNDLAPQLLDLIRCLGDDAPARAPAAVIAPAAEPSASPAPLSSTPAPAPAEPRRQLRLEAAQMESLLGLAREAVLVNRAQQRQSTQLLALRQAQRSLDRTFDGLREALRQKWPTERLEALLDSAGTASRRCSTLLEQHVQDHAGQARRGHRVSTRLHHSVNSSRMVRFGEVEATLKRLVRDTGQRLGKALSLSLQGSQTQVDRDVLERIDAPLAHMLRNAIDHGLETQAERERAGKSAAARLTVTARHHRGQLEISVGDNGRGIDLDWLRGRIAEKGLSPPEMLRSMGDSELLDFLFLPGFSTRDAVSETSGRGVGLDVVQNCVQGLGGRLRVDNRPGQGLTITLVLPVSLSMMRVLLVQVADETYALPLAQLEKVMHLAADEVHWLAGQACVQVAGREITCAALGPLLGVAAPAAGQPLVLVEIVGRTGRFGLVVDRLLGECELALMALDARLPKPVHVAAAAVLEDGSPVLLLDLADVASSLAQRGGTPEVTGAAAGALAPVQRVLVVEDSFTVREVERKVLVGGGYQVDVAVDGVEGWNALSTKSYDLVVTDIDMPRMNGLELLRRMRAHESLRKLPVMIVSYKDRESDRMAGLQAGADRYFVKSGFEESALLQAVADLIGPAHAHRDRQ